MAARKAVDHLPPVALKVLRFVLSYQRRKGYMPTLREVAEATDMASHTGAKYYLEMLECHGYIERGDRYTARTMRITDAGRRVAGA